MNNEDLWRDKTKGLFNIVEWTRFWNYIYNLQVANEELEDYKSRCEKAIEFMNIADLSFVKNQELLLNILQNGSENQ